MNNKAIETIFDAAIQFNLGDKREAYLRLACDGDPQLREKIEDMLRAHERAGEFFEEASAELRTHFGEELEGEEEVEFPELEPSLDAEIEFEEFPEEEEVVEIEFEYDEFAEHEEFLEIEFEYEEFDFADLEEFVFDGEFEYEEFHFGDFEEFIFHRILSLLT